MYYCYFAGSAVVLLLACCCCGRTLHLAASQCLELWSRVEGILAVSCWLSSQPFEKLYHNECAPELLEVLFPERWSWKLWFNAKFCVHGMWPPRSITTMTSCAPPCCIFVAYLYIFQEVFATVDVASGQDVYDLHSFSRLVYCADEQGGQIACFANV